jgi:hypothetical protein
MQPHTQTRNCRRRILSYSRSHGLFASISLSGATLRPDRDANRELYGHEATNPEILTDDFKTPAAARSFEKALHRNSAHRDPYLFGAGKRIREDIRFYLRFLSASHPGLTVSGHMTK